MVGMTRAPNDTADPGVGWYYDGGTDEQLFGPIPPICTFNNCSIDRFELNFPVPTHPISAPPFLQVSGLTAAPTGYELSTPHWPYALTKRANWELYPTRTIWVYSWAHSFCQYGGLV